MYETTYHRPTTLAEAAALFAAADDAAYLSGGHTLLPTLKGRLAAPSSLIDLRHIPELNRIAVTAAEVSTGPGMTHAEVAQSAEVKAVIPALAALAASIGDDHYRHRGTIRRSETGSGQVGTPVNKE